MNPFTYAFIGALIFTLALRWMLSVRHLRHVARHRDAVPEAFAGTISLAAHQKAADYTTAKTRLGLFQALADTVLVAVLTLGGGLDALQWLSANLAGGELSRGILLIALVAGVSMLVSLPFGLYTTFGIERRFGFNRMTFRLWLADAIKGLLLGALIGLPLAGVILFLMQASGSLWWLYAWLVWSGFSLLMLVLYPTFIAPLFNRFTPLAQGALRARIEALLARTGFASNGIFVMDGSRRSSHGNAYFTGMGRAKRIVFFDTLLKELDDEEIEAVLAHELGHFRRRHITQRMIFSFALTLGFLYLLGQLLDQAWFYAGLGVSQPGTAVALVLFTLVMPVFTFVFTPLSSLLSRRHEYEADAFAATEARADALVSALVKLYRDNASTLTPDPMHSAFYDSHPPAALRIGHLKGLNA
ncbi:Zn-dependent protease with chaperone function [Gulbenkiania indica]|uniref:Zn-dependent protease with chaperone function n=2 Tax=Gulbenkiania TaxID=397456 RepID=A0A0K6H0X3_9NEIS|nr:M48 family metallopeptidase [Gulbenkiania indica]TCW31377.1 STE24 endopeptidase [Gulbenkiania mobilis]CUA84617.1 Zn-dependent protease with chaperone function [Gulbenkiania indica]